MESVANEAIEVVGARPREPGEGQTPLEREAHAVLDLAEGISRGLERLRSAQARAASLRLPEFALLSVVRAAGDEGVTVSEAALSLGVRPQALSGPAAGLAGMGLLRRGKDPSDGRARRLHITIAGRDRLDRAEPVRRRLAKELLARVPAPNVALLVLTRLDAALGQALEGGPAR